MRGLSDPAAVRGGEIGKAEVADPRPAVAADQDGSGVDHQAIDEGRTEERRCRLSAAFDEEDAAQLSALLADVFGGLGCEALATAGESASR